MITLRAKDKDENIITFGDEQSFSALQAQAISDVTHAMLVRPDTKTINIVVDESLEPKDEYYIRDIRQVIGNSCVWWEINGNGYTSDLKKAKIFTKEKALSIVLNNKETIDTYKYAAYPKAEIDNLIEHHINGDLLFFENLEVKK